MIVVRCVAFTCKAVCASSRFSKCESSGSYAELAQASKAGILCELSTCESKQVIDKASRARARFLSIHSRVEADIWSGVWRQPSGARARTLSKRKQTASSTRSKVMMSDKCDDVRESFCLARECPFSYICDFPRWLSCREQSIVNRCCISRSWWCRKTKGGSAHRPSRHVRL